MSYLSNSKNLMSENNNTKSKNLKEDIRNS